MLYLKSNIPEEFNRIRAERSDAIIPDEMKEQSIEIYESDISIDSNNLSTPLDPNKQ